MSANESDDRGGLLRSVLPPDQVDRLFDFCGAHGWKLLAVGAVLGALPPLAGLEQGYYMTVVSEMDLFAILALSWDVVGGQTGYPSFGNMAFFGIGAYVTAILVKDFAVTFPVALVAAGLLAVAFAAVIGARPSIEADRRPDRGGRFGLRSPRSLRSPLRVRGTALSKETGRGCGVEKSGLGQI